MTKILILVLAVVLVASISFFYLFTKGDGFPALQNNSSFISPQGSIQSKSTGVLVEPTIASTEASVSALENRVTTLEATVVDLQKQINAQNSTVPALSTSKTPLYIPLGTGASSSALDWETSNAFQVTIDSSQYPGYSSMQLEMGLQVFQGNGVAYARLYNATDNQAISNSDVSSPNDTFTWQTSNFFRLPAGSKIYKLQLRTNTTYQASEQNARIKVNF